MVLEPGTLIGARYRLETLVAEGGMGVVWAAEDVSTGQRCAVKLMKDAGSPQLRERFLHEGRLASRVSHDNVVRILEVLEPESGSPAIVMELLDGESLRAVLERDHKLAIAALAEIVVPVISAVGTAHAHGIVHRDLKPENVFLVKMSRSVKVLDFGIAKLTPLDGEARRSTGNTTGVVWGTPRYMAPEQASGAKADHRADIWSLGIILYECLSGVCPTHGDDVLQVLTNVALKPFEPLRQIAPDVPEEIAHLVTRMLSRKPSERPTLLEVLDTLEPFAATPGGRFGDPVPSPDAFAPTVAVMPLRARRKLVRIGVVMIPVVAMAAGFLAMCPRRERSPLDSPDAKLACPVLRASGVKEPAGWLGAAAAAVACERARVVLGGRKARTLVPAELLDLPGEPSDAFRSDPYGQPGAVEASLIAARRRSHAYLDGEVIWTSPGFTVKLSLRAADGAQLAGAEGQGKGLYEAVRAAMTPLVDSGSIPKAAKLEPQIAAWSLTESVDDALAVVDLTFAIAHNAGGLVKECQRFEEISPRLRALGVEGRWLCAYVLGRESPELTLDADEALPAKAHRVRINHVYYRRSEPGDAEFMQTKLLSETTSRGQALLAVTTSCLLHAEKDVAREFALRAVKSEPSTAVLGWCTPWGELAALDGNTKREGAWRARQAWQPWDPRVWAPPEDRVSNDEFLALVPRARVLTPFDSIVARRAAKAHLQARDPSAALGIASSLGAGGLPIHELEKQLLLAMVDASEAKFGMALERARAAERSGDDAGWMRAQRFDFAWLALELAELLGDPREVADAMVVRFLDPDPPRIDRHVAGTASRIPALCVRASRADHCFERFRALRPQLLGLITQQGEEFIAGAELYSAQDLAGAAEKWRPLVPRFLQLDRETVEAFEHTRQSDLAEQIDEAIMKRAWEYNGATLGHVRAAHRALVQGDRERARQLAEQVIQAWGQADVVPPALVDMRELVEKLRRH
jgi:hypothetical protein